MAELNGNPSTTSDVDLNAGPPASSRKPKKSTQSLFNQSSSDLQSQQMAGFGQEGGSSEIMALQFMAMLQKGVQGLSAMYPGLTPLLSDVMGRLQMAIPTLIQDTQNGGMGFVPMAGMPPQLPMGPPGMPPAGPAGPPPMGGPQGAPMGPPPIQR